ncbi:MAG: prolyl oligopeptidase family serine peptidase [Candidatus Brocadiia bacterium]
MQHRAVIAFLLLLLPLAGADVVRLKNGNILEGKVVEKTEELIRLKTGKGTVSIARAEVESIEAGETPIEAYTRIAAELADDDARGHMELAQYCIDNHLVSQAIAELRYVRSLQPENQEALEKLRTILDRRASRLYRRAKDLQEKGYYIEAERPLVELLEQYPESSYAARAHHRLAAGYAAREDYEKALVRWRRALEADPKLTEACTGAAQAAIETGQWATALEFTRKAIETTEDPAQARDLGQRAATLEELVGLRQGAEAASAKPDRLIREGELLLRLGLGQRAMARLEDAYQAGARQPELLRRLARHHERQGDVRRALELCDQLAKRQRPDDELLQRRARLQRLLLVPQALATGERAERERLLYEIAKSGASLEYIARVLRQSTRRPPAKTGLVEGTFLVDEVLTRASYHAYVPEDYDPQAPRGLLLALHRDGESSKDHFYNVETLVRELGLLAMLPSPTRESASWRFQDIRLVLSALREAKDRYNVDTNRVYLSGTGAGGLLAWAVALRHPDRFAALVVRNGRVDEVTRFYLPAAINLPIFQVVAERSSLDVVGSARQVHTALEKMGYEAQREEVPGYRRHPALPELNEKIAEWLRGKARQPYTSRVRLVSFEHSNGKAFWVRIDRFAPTVFDPDRKLDIQPPFGMEYTPEQLRALYLDEMGRTLAQVNAAIASGNRISIQCRHVDRLTVFLEDSMVDLEKPVRIYVNGELRFNGKAERSLAHLFDTARLHRDPRMCYSASVRIDLP